jgi:hypothetical protein
MVLVEVKGSGSVDWGGLGEFVGSFAFFRIAQRRRKEKAAFLSLFVEIFEGFVDAGGFESGGFSPVFSVEFGEGALYKRNGVENVGVFHVGDAKDLSVSGSPFCCGERPWARRRKRIVEVFFEVEII